MTPHEENLRAQITRLEAELTECERQRELDADRMREEWETLLRVWATRARREGSDYAGATFEKAANEIAIVRAKAMKARNANDN